MPSGSPLRLDADDRPRVDAIAPLVDVLHGRGKLLGQHAGQEAEPPHVDAEHRDLLLADTTRRLEHRAVTTQGEGEVGLEVAPIDQLVDIQPVAEDLRELPGELPLHQYRGPMLAQDAQYRTDAGGVARLVSVAKNGKT